MSSAAENELLARCRQGEAQAWDQIFDLHYAATGRFVFQLAPDLSREDVEEICQETFLAVIKTIGSFQGNSQFQTWLFRIAANKAHDYRERQRAAKRGSGQAPLSLQAEDPQKPRQPRCKASLRFLLPVFRGKRSSARATDSRSTPFRLRPDATKSRPAL